MPRCGHSEQYCRKEHTQLHHFCGSTISFFLRTPGNVGFRHTAATTKSRSGQEILRVHFFHVLFSFAFFLLFYSFCNMYSGLLGFCPSLITILMSTLMVTPYIIIFPCVVLPFWLWITSWRALAVSVSPPLGMKKKKQIPKKKYAAGLL